MAEWKRVRLGEIVSVNDEVYSSFDKWAYINYLDTGSVTENSITKIQRLKLGVDEIPSRARRKAYLGDIVYSTVRPNQRHYAIMQNEIDNLIVSTGFAVIRAIRSIVEPLFIYYYLSQDDVVAHLQLVAEQSVSTYPSLNPSDITNLVLSIPPLPTQRKIAAVLGVIDDKIETNRKICANLEAQAQALFKSWFVDFEPFGGKMPKGWKMGKLGDVTENIKARVGREDREVLSAVAEGKLVLSREYFTKQVFSADIAKYIIVDEWDFAYNPARINIGSIGVNDLGVQGCVSPVYVSFRVDKDYRQFFSLSFKTSSFNDQVKMRANGSVRQILTYDDFGKIPWIYPERNTIKEFNRIYDSLYDVIRHHEKQSRALVAMRDALLPKLMSGEIDVSKVEVA